jgi:hypothetical protein
MFSRRGALSGLAAASLVSPASAKRVSLDFKNPRDNLTAWMKLHTSLQDGGLWYWYRARLDVAIPSKPVATLCGYDTLYRYNVRKLSDEKFEVMRWECSIYTDAKTNQIIDTLENPFNGRTVRPFHFKEGPVTFHYTPNRPRIVGSPVLGEGDGPFLLDWTVVGDDVWVSNEVFVSFPNLLKPSEWPLESSGEMTTFSNISTLRGSLAALEDPAQNSVNCLYTYQATSRWMPWMLMGPLPGNLIWRAQGAKLVDTAAIPPDSLAAFKRIHPEVFNPVPWTEKRVMYLDYAKARTPGKP